MPDKAAVRTDVTWTAWRCCDKVGQVIEGARDLHMSNSLDPALQTYMTPLLQQLPLDSAMSALVVREPVAPELVGLVEKMLEDPFWQKHAALRAGLWLYVDGLHESHRISQNMPGATGAFWHGIMHRREGDFGNAKHWFHQAGDHPVLETLPEHDPCAFVDDVQAAVDNQDALVERQRQEWLVLMQWCYEHPGR